MKEIVFNISKYNDLFTEKDELDSHENSEEVSTCISSEHEKEPKVKSVDTIGCYSLSERRQKI